MSPDDIFAAQFWAWPDPAIKRDVQGRVMFVNAAFLRLYGGAVEDWRGNAVGGWSAPQPAMSGQAPAPFRFETRMADGQGGDIVFDWMEQTLSGGNAFALARDVTPFTHAPQPDPGEPVQVHAEPAAQPPAQPPAMDTQAPAEASFAAAPAADYIPAAQPTVFEEPVQQAPAYQAPAHQAHGAELPPVSIPDVAIPDVAIPDLPIPETTHLAPPAPVENTQTLDVPTAEAARPTAAARLQPEREFERRALPIESNDAVLGNNWRDAVIAKAVGATSQAADPVEETPAAAQETSSNDVGPIRILLAEDNAINALLTRTLLEAEGHTVDTVEDGQLAVEALRTQSYDLIFMDMRMPNMDGLEATRKIRTLVHVPKDLPIVALTANAFDDDRNACFDSGMNDFMTKPVSAEELSEMVETWTVTNKKKDAA